VIATINAGVGEPKTLLLPWLTSLDTEPKSRGNTEKSRAGWYDPTPLLTHQYFLGIPDNVDV